MTIIAIVVEFRDCSCVFAVRLLGVSRERAAVERCKGLHPSRGCEDESGE